MRTVVSHVDEAWDGAVARYEGRDDEYHLVLAETGKASTTLAHMREPISDFRIGLWRDVPPAQLDAVRTYVHGHGLGSRYDRIVTDSAAFAAAEAAR